MSLIISSEYVTGTITGIIATLIGFLLTMVYEWKKQNKSDKMAKVKTIELLTNELKDNLAIAKTNLDLFTRTLLY